MTKYHVTKYQETWEIYCRTWSNALRILLGWSDEKIAKYITEMEQFGPMMFHDPPEYYLSSTIIWETIGKEGAFNDATWGNLECAMRNVERISVNNAEEWRALKNRVNEVLHHYYRKGI